MKTKTYKWIEDLNKDELILLTIDLYNQIEKLKKKIKREKEK